MIKPLSHILTFLIDNLTKKSFLFSLIILFTMPHIHPQTATKQSLSMMQWLKRLLNKPQQQPNMVHIGYVELVGEIVDSKKITDQLDEFLETPYIKGVLIKIDSGGGQPGASCAMHNELLKFREKKPVVVLVENTCCSGAYLFACAANCIVAPASADVGSIGVRFERYAYKENPVLKSNNMKAKIEYENLSHGKHKTTWSSGYELSQEQRDYIKELLSNSYRIFCSKVAACRNLSLESINDWADGKIFTANQALELKLIDMLGSISDAKEALKGFIEKKNNNMPIDKLVIIGPMTN